MGQRFNRTRNGCPGIVLLVALCLPGYGRGQGFLNLDFERARVVSNDPDFGYLDWALAAPGWDHDQGGDAGIVYYGQEHLGLTGYHLLMDSTSPRYAPGTQLAGAYSMAFSSGHATFDGQGWTVAYLAQTGVVPADAQSIRLLATGSFAVFLDGAPIAMHSQGGNAYAGSIAGYAGAMAELRIANTSLQIHDPVVVDNIRFSPEAVPETSNRIGIPAGLALLLALRRRAAWRRPRIRERGCRGSRIPASFATMAR